MCMIWIEEMLQSFKRQLKSPLCRRLILSIALKAKLLLFSYQYCSRHRAELFACYLGESIHRTYEMDISPGTPGKNMFSSQKVRSIFWVESSV